MRNASPGRLVFVALYLAGVWAADIRTGAAEPASVVPALPVPRVVVKLPGSPCAISPDQRLLAVVAGNNDVLLVRTDDGQTVAKLTGHAGAISGVAFSPDGQRVATSSFDDSVRLWETATGRELRRVAVATNDFEAVAFAPNGTVLAAPNDDKQLWVVGTEGGSPQKLSGNTANYQRSVAFAPGGTTLASAGGGAVILWDAVPPRLRAKLDTPEAVVLFSPQGNLLATYGGVNTIRLRDATTGAVVRELSGHSHPVHRVAFAPRGKYLASAATDETEAILWNTATGDVVLRLPHRQKVLWVAFSSDGQQLYTFSDTLQAWPVTVLDDPAQLAAFTAYGDGEKDHYARFIRIALAPKTGPKIPHLGPKAGRVITTIVRRKGTTLEAADLQLGGEQVKDSISVQKDGSKQKLESRKVQMLEVVAVRDKAADVRVHFLDGQKQDATLPTGTGTVRGTSAVGTLADDLAEIASLTFDFQYVEQKAEVEPAVSRTQFRAEILDRQGGRLAASAVRAAASGEMNELPLFLDDLSLKVPFRNLREVSTLLLARGGAIVKVIMADGTELCGFISTSQVPAVRGTVPYGTFSINLEELKAIRFH